MLPVSSPEIPARGSRRARGGSRALASVAVSAGCSGRRLLCGACAPTERLFRWFPGSRFNYLLTCWVVHFLNPNYFLLPWTGVLLCGHFGTQKDSCTLAFHPVLVDDIGSIRSAALQTQTQTAALGGAVPPPPLCKSARRPPSSWLGPGWDLAGTSLGLPVDRVTMQKEALGRGAWRACCVHR